MKRKRILCCAAVLAASVGLTWWFFPIAPIATIKRVIAGGSG